MGSSVRPVSTLAEAFAEAVAMAAPLAARLASYAAKLSELNPPFAEAYDGLVAKLALSGAGSNAPAVGDKMPSFLLPDGHGRLVGLEQLLMRGPVVISMNRGHWCPFCRLELHGLNQARDRIAELGASVVSIMPERQQYAGRLREEGIGITILSDIDNGYAMELGLIMWVGNRVQKLMMKRGFELDAYQGNGGWFLPLPATFVVGRDGFIVARFVDPDFRKRMDIEEIISALEAEAETRR
jgi:peroxiredoxin